MLSLLSGFTSKVYLMVIAILGTLLLTSLMGNYFLNNSLESTKKDLVISEVTHKVLVEDLKEVNKKIEQKEIEFDNWKKQNSKVKYKTIVKWKETIKGSSCDEKVKSIANINFNNL